MLKVALVGHDTRNDNLGVGALTVANVELIRRVACAGGVPVEINVLAGFGDRPSCVGGGDLTERTVRPLRKPWDFFSAVRSSDLVIDISGGDSFADIYGGKRIFQDLLQKYLVLLARRPLVVAPQTIGPFNKAPWRAMALHTLRQSALVATRDERSTRFLRNMGYRGAVIEASDVALRLPYAPPSARSSDGPPRVGLNVSGLLMNGGYSRNNMFGLKADYPSLIRQIVRHFVDHEDGCELHLVGHVIPQQRNTIEDDFQASLDLAVEFPQVIVAPAFVTPSEAKSYIAGLDFFMGARMHACIAAFSTGVPVVPMAYSRKFEGLFGSLGYGHTVDCTTESAEAILAKIKTAYATRKDLKRAMEPALQRGVDRLDTYETALEALIKLLATPQL